MNDKLQEIKTDLAVNGKQTKEKRLVIAEFSSEITYKFLFKSSLISPIYDIASTTTFMPAFSIRRSLACSSVFLSAFNPLILADTSAKNYLWNIWIL
jgi:hypothetical protein